MISWQISWKDIKWIEKTTHKQDSPNIYPACFRRKLFMRSTRSIRTDGNFTDLNNFPIGGFYWEEHEKLNQNNKQGYEIEH